MAKENRDEHAEIDNLSDAISAMIDLPRAMDRESFRKGMDRVMASLDAAVPRIEVPKIEVPARLYDPTTDKHAQITVEGILSSTQKRWDDAAARFEKAADIFHQSGKTGEA